MVQISRVVLFTSAMVVAMASCSSSKSEMAPATPPAQADPVLHFEQYTLPNGLQVMLHEDHRVPLVHVNIWYRVGSMQEKPGRTGFAHLFEHLMFQGSRHVGDDEHFRLLEEAGQSEVNGTTDFDRTNYFETVPREELPLALWLESDRMGWLLDTLTQQKLDGQRAVVKNERREHYDGAPYGLGYLALQGALFPEGHPYHYPPIGRMEDLDAASLEDVKEFFKTYYAPSNASLVIAGDFEPKEAKALIEKAFGNIPARPAPAKPVITTPPLTKEVRQLVDERVAPLPQTTMSWLSPQLFAPGDAELDVLANILSAGKGSRLYKALVEEQHIAQTIHASQHSAMVQGDFSIGATAAPGHTAEELEVAMNKVLEELASKPLPADEVARSLQTMELSLLRSLEHIQSRAEWLQTFSLYTGDPSFLPKHLAAYRAVTPESILKVVREVLRKDARVVQLATPKPRLENEPDAVDVVKPEGGHPKLPPVDAWRAQPPPPLVHKDVTIPVPERAVLDNGLTVLAVHRNGLPLVSFALVTRMGAALDPPRQEGRNALAISMLTEGSEGGDAAAQADAFAGLGTHLGAQAGLEASNVGVVVHKRNGDQALHLLSKVITSPSLHPKAFERVKERSLTSMAERLHDPMGVASHLFARMAVGVDHPYGHPRDGTLAGLSQTSLENVQTLLKQQWTAKNMALIAVGDITLEEAKRLAIKHFGTLPAGEAVVLNPPQPVATKRVDVVAVEIAGTPQTVIMAARPGVGVADPDEPVLSVLNSTLGGSFSSRLNLNLREDKGITYGAFSVEQPFKTAGMVVAGASVQSGAVELGLRELMAELGGYVKRPVTPAELHLARESYTRSLPGMFEGVEEVAGAYGRVFALDLPLDHLARQPARYDAITQKDVDAMAARILRPDEMQLLLVGDRKVVDAAAKANGLGVVRWVDVSGKPVGAGKP